MVLDNAGFPDCYFKNNDYDIGDSYVGICEHMLAAKGYIYVNELTDLLVKIKTDSKTEAANFLWDSKPYSTDNMDKFKDGTTRVDLLNALVRIEEILFLKGSDKSTSAAVHAFINCLKIECKDKIDQISDHTKDELNLTHVVILPLPAFVA